MFLLLAAGCRRDDPEAALLATLVDVQTALEKRDAAALGGALAADFVGPEGLDADGAERMARAMFLRYRNVDVSVGPPAVAMTGGHATVKFEAMLTGGQGRILPDAVRVYSIESGWRLEGDDWRLTSIHWEPRM
ncbi:nuclear transport factor 2 family protein [Marilutibacter chinensis]|uniref:Nuclear transport factor 2 family protein n=1 Tax=Marilutibacter chinensis TaxID=2912247 RepID=A0ABS9HMT1_9GAMM|nr:nuclear transport factor 2 family protein [Lysobacter chinensis]MCF7220321.1 nuclear transport factor 2 family protein [Lysobacter chinensis]